MFNCKFSLCDHVSETVIEFILHSKLHSNTPNYKYHCSVPECSRMYRKANVLKTHMYRKHTGLGSSVQSCKQFETPLKYVAQFKSLKLPHKAFEVTHMGRFRNQMPSEVVIAALQLHPL